MADATGAERRVMTRGNEVRRPLASLSNKERGLRAAMAVLKDGHTAISARSSWLVDADCLRYYMGKLAQQGVGSRGAGVGEAGERGKTKSAEVSAITQSSTLSNKRTAWNDYRHAYVFAGQMVTEGKSKKAAAQLAQGKFGVAISASTALRASKNPGEPPKKSGKPLIIEEWIERRLENLVEALRELHMPVFRCMVLNYANSLISGTKIQEQLKHRELRRHWYYSWLNRCTRGLHTGNMRPLELTRAQWATPANLQHHYNQLAMMLVELGIAVKNPSYDPSKPYDEELKITKPGRMISMDETRLTNDTMEAHKGKANRILMKKGDDGTTVVNKGGGDGTGIGGSTADGMDLPGFFIFANNIIHSGGQDDDVAPEVRPQCRRIDPTKPGQLLPCRFWANAKGGVTGDLGVRYIRGCVEPAIEGLSPSNPAILIMDGHGSHFTLELLTYCRQIGLHVLLRPPHTTHILQGEDVQHFAVFKPAYHQAKIMQVHENALQGCCRLKASDLLRCVKAPWEKAFNLENTLKAWDKTGLSPFTRRVYWDLKAKEEQRKVVAASVDIDPDKLSVTGMVRVLFPKAAAAADAHNAREQEQAGSGEGGEQLPPGVKKGKRTRGEAANSSDLWFYEGGATGDEVFNLVKAKTEAKAAKEQKTKDNQEKRAQARKDRIAAANGMGADKCAVLTSQAQVQKLKVPEIKACLTFKGIPFPKQAKKADLVALLIKEIDLPVDEPPGPSADEEVVDASAFIDSEDGEDDESGESDPESEDEADLLF